MNNRMKFVMENGKMKEFNKLESLTLNAFPISNYFMAKNQMAVALESYSGSVKRMQNYQIIDIGEVKRNFKKIMNQWFPFGQKNTTMAVGILWTAFVTYVFPWMLDIAKVYCAFMIAQGFYNEHKGVGGGKAIGGGSERSGFSSFVYYGKWLVAFHLIPIGVELLDQVGAKMLIDIKTNPANG